MKKTLDLEAAPKSEEGLPMAYQHPTEYRIKWLCNRDEEGRITSVTVFPEKSAEFPTGRKVDYLPNIEMAREIQDAVLKEGWKEMVPRATITLE